MKTSDPQRKNGPLAAASATYSTSVIKMNPVSGNSGVGIALLDFRESNDIINHVIC